MNNRLINSVIDRVYLNLQSLQEKKKKLSKKQKKIAKLAKPYDELDGDDFAKLRAGEKIDEFVEELDERKKRKKRKSKKPKPNVYQRKKYKARAGTKRGDTMARLSNKIRKGKKLTKADYKARDDSEAAERKKKGYKSKPRFDTGMYLSKKRGLTPSSVYSEYRKGLAAYYSSGSRKGMTAHQWAHARVNSANPSKSWAVVKKAKGKKKK
jgi:hypothetical protein